MISGINSIFNFESESSSVSGGGTGGDALKSPPQEFC